MISALTQAARRIGRAYGERIGGVVVTSWAVSRPSGNGITSATSASAGTVTGTIFRESKPTLSSPAPGVPLMGVRRWILVVEAGSVAVGDVLTSGSLSFTVVTQDAEQLGTWEMSKP